MADIIVRKVRIDFDQMPVDFDLPPRQLDRVLPTVGLSMTMPYLEPYLIRTMKVAIPRIEDAGLAEDARRFSQQEGHHYRNHANLNERIRDAFRKTSPPSSAPSKPISRPTINASRGRRACVSTWATPRGSRR